MTDNGRQSLLLRTFSANDPPFMYFADRVNLKSLHEASVVMFDGTFKYTPREFYRTEYEVDGEVNRTSGQVYTMHAVYSDLPDKQTNFLCGRFYFFVACLILRV